MYIAIAFEHEMQIKCYKKRIVTNATVSFNWLQMLQCQCLPYFADGECYAEMHTVCIQHTTLSAFQRHILKHGHSAGAENVKIGHLQLGAA